MNDRIYITECPRDAMQGIKQMIPAELKAKYLNRLLKCGFDRLDFGSFVSPKAIPQMADTVEVLKKLDLDGTNTKLLAIVANKRGAEDATQFDEISFLGYPFSVSPTFQKRNVNQTLEESLSLVEEMQNLTEKKGKKLLVYLSMAFGNPYGDRWSPELVVEWALKISSLGVKHLALADTVGCSDKENISPLFRLVSNELPSVTVSAHLHSTPQTAKEKILAAIDSGCRYFDGALKGYGGCPMAKDTLTGNIATETILECATEKNLKHGVNFDELSNALELTNEIFNQYHS